MEDKNLKKQQQQQPKPQIYLLFKNYVCLRILSHYLLIEIP